MSNQWEQFKQAEAKAVQEYTTKHAKEIEEKRAREQALAEEAEAQYQAFARNMRDVWLNHVEKHGPGQVNGPMAQYHCSRGHADEAIGRLVDELDKTGYDWAARPCQPCHGGTMDVAYFEFQILRRASATQATR